MVLAERELVQDAGSAFLFSEHRGFGVLTSMDLARSRGWMLSLRLGDRLSSDMRLT